MTRMLPALAAAVLLCACSGSDGRAQSDSGASAGARSVSAPEETQPPNVPSQKPAFPGQTRAPRLTTATAFQVVTVARGLENPWGLAFLPDGRMLVTERPGRLRIVSASGALSPPVQGVPAVVQGGQLGLYGLALDPQFAGDHRLYFAYSEPRGGGSTLAVARAELAEGATPRLQNLQVIFRAQPVRAGTANIGGRLVFARDGTLFVTVGDRFSAMDLAQTLDNDLGKLVRINPDGSIPRDNPFVGRRGARPEIWSYGHRNSEAAAINPWTGKLWIVEHGARGGDEVNIPEAGKNYGWPVITYGEDYSGLPIGAGITQKAGMEQPIYYWDPVLAPSGMAFYDASLFPAWKGSLFVGGLKPEHLARLTLKGDRVVGEEWLLTELGERIRDVVVGPDGAVYVLTDNDRGRVLKLAPK
jgi:glucose/arabinose dehydrogenase